MNHKFFFVLLLVSAPCYAQNDVNDIAALLGRTFDKPDARVISNPIVTEGDYAVADWVQGNRGGRAVLSRQMSNWKIISCGGAAMLKKENLVSAGIPEEQASVLEKKLALAESAIDKNHIQLFNSFQGKSKH